MAVSISEEERRGLVQASLDARRLSYSPYSKFRVGAALLCHDKHSNARRIVLGANVENASYGGTICAERTAIVKAMTSHDAQSAPPTILAVAVAGDIDGHCSPCGICRQVIREFCTLDTPVYLPFSSWTVDNDKEGRSVVSTTLGALLPMSFGPEDLEKDRQVTSS